MNDTASAAPTEAPTPRRRLTVPGAIFAATVAPSFLLFDAGGASIAGERDWLRDGPETVQVAPSDLEALHRHLLAGLPAIVRRTDIAAEDRAWALHRALLAATAGLFRDEGRLAATAHLTGACRQLATFTADSPQRFAFLEVIAGSRLTPITRAVETAVFAVALAAADGMRDIEALTALALGGVFADTGKLTLSGEMLSKAEPLAEAEWARMREHPARSVEIMRRCGVLEAGAVRGALHHHERWDGGGYPDGQRGEDIPIEARYLAVADAYSALTVDRPFSEHRDTFGALSEMAQSSGQFEPRLLRLFVPLLSTAPAAAPSTTPAAETTEAAA